MESSDLKVVGDNYRAEVELYERVAKHVEGRLKSSLRAAGIGCTTSCRPKDIISLLRKVMRGRNPADIGDKAGARAVLVYEDQVEPAKQVIRHSFCVMKEDDKKEGLSARDLAYLGVHFDVRLRAEDVPRHDLDLVGRLCEIQVHTRAQNIWAEVSHDLVYKARNNVSKNVERRIMRLEALVEIFDEEVARARRDILAEPGFVEARMLHALEPLFVRFGGESYDEALSIEVLSFMKNALRPHEVQSFVTLISTFVNEHQAKLEILIPMHQRVRPSNPLLLQPEALLIYERLQNEAFKLIEAWARHQPVSLLRSFADEWGTQLPEIA